MNIDVRGALLSVPASRPELIDKAIASGASAVIVDLEDAVARSDKDEARRRTVEWLAAHADLELPVIVRINQVGSPWCHLDAIALAAGEGKRPGLMLPKTESAADIGFLDRLVTGVESGTASPLPLLALIESAAGISDLAEIASASPRLRALTIGYADLAANLGRPTGTRSWLFAQEAVLTAARSAGILAIDGPHLGIDLDEAFARSLADAVEGGFDAKWVLHPRQVSPASEAFAPDVAEISQARAIVAALDTASESGAGVTSVGGLMVDEAVAVAARRVLALADAAGSK